MAYIKKLFNLTRNTNLKNLQFSEFKNFSYYADFGQAFFLLLFLILMLSRHVSTLSVFSTRENFSIFLICEFLLFVFILFAFISFFNLIKINDIPVRTHIKTSYVEVFVANILSLFSAYLLIIILNGISYAGPNHFFWIFRTFGYARINLHSHEYVLLGVKAVYLFLVIVMLYSLGNYLKQGSITFQFFNLVVLMTGAGLFVMSLSNIFYILLIFDAISLLVVAVVALSTNLKNEKYLTYAFHYFLLSAITSLFAYLGCLILHEIFNSYDLNAIAFILRECGDSYSVNTNFFVLGSVFILIKIFFLLGIFPFYQYVLEISSAVNYAFLLYFLVVSKLPVMLFFVYFAKIIGFNFILLKQFVLLISLSSIIFSAFFIATAVRIKQFLAFSSINQFGFILALFAFNDLIGASVGIFYFFSYCLASTSIIFFLSFVINKEQKTGLGKDLDTGPDLARAVHDSYLNVNIKRNLNIGSEVAHVDNENVYFLLGLFASGLAFLTLAGFPPFAGFFLKLSFVEIFIAHNYYYTAFLTVLLSLVTTYAYTNVLILLQPEFRGIDSNNNIYRSRLFNINKFGAAVFLIFILLFPIISVFSANVVFFELIIEYTNLFFYDNVHHFFSNNYLYFKELLFDSNGPYVALISLLEPGDPKKSPRVAETARKRRNFLQRAFHKLVYYSFGPFTAGIGCKFSYFWYMIYYTSIRSAAVFPRDYEYFIKEVFPHLAKNAHAGIPMPHYAALYPFACIPFFIIYLYWAECYRLDIYPDFKIFNTYPGVSKAEDKRYREEGSAYTPVHKAYKAKLKAERRVIDERNAKSPEQYKSRKMDAENAIKNYDEQVRIFEAWLEARKKNEKNTEKN